MIIKGAGLPFVAGPCTDCLGFLGVGNSEGSGFGAVDLEKEGMLGGIGGGVLFAACGVGVVGGRGGTTAFAETGGGVGSLGIESR